MSDWTIHRYPDSDNIEIRRDTGERHVATIHAPIWENDEANAKLIHAAPDMRDALRLVMSHLDEDTPIAVVDAVNEAYFKAVM